MIYFVIYVVVSAQGINIMFCMSVEIQARLIAERNACQNIL